eukprot:5243362-Alexandrium_andersonii.AAC.1
MVAARPPEGPRRPALRRLLPHPPLDQELSTPRSSVCGPGECTRALTSHCPRRGAPRRPDHGRTAPRAWFHLGHLGMQCQGLRRGAKQTACVHRGCPARR